MKNEQLVQEAKKAQRNAYVPYSHFPVGACLLTKDGQLIYGCNIENSSYGATICAERVAIFQAVSKGITQFDKIAIVGGDCKTSTFPCGICLQVMQEFMPEGKIILSDEQSIYEYSLSDLLPHGFTL